MSTDAKDIELTEKRPVYTGSKDNRGSKELVDTGYKPVMWGKYHICCHMSWEDTFLVAGIYLAIWAFVLGFFVLLLQAALLSDEAHTVLWMYFYTFLILVAFVGGAVATGGNATKDTSVAGAQEGEADEDGDAEMA